MLRSLSYYTKAIHFLFSKGLGWFMVFPIIITILVFIGGFSLTNWATDAVYAILNDWVGEMSWLPDWASWIRDAIYWLVWLILRVMLYFVLAFVGGSIILLLMAPILTWLSEKVAAKMGKDVPEFNLVQFMRDLTRAAGLAIKNGVIQLGLSIGCFILGFVPVIGLAAPFLLFGINAYFYGYNFMDYTLERRKLSARESNSFVWTNRFQSIGLGSPYALWILVPVIGPVTYGFVAVFATVAATLSLEDQPTGDVAHL